MKYKTQQYASALYESLKSKDDIKRKEIVRNFIRILGKNKDSSKINSIIRQFEKIYLAEHGLTKVHVESASIISAKLKDEIKKTVGKPLALSESVDPKLLGGITLLVDDSLFIDGSARTRLEKIFK